jgi:glycine cleavage system regulatory protein
MSGETLFQADAKLWIPNECPQAELRRELEHLADDLMVDLSLQELPTPPAHASRD